MSTASFIPVLADLVMATGQHHMPPNDDWKSPMNAGSNEKQNYMDGIGKSKWGMAFPVADGIVSYFATQDPHFYHFTAASAMTLVYKQFIYAMISAAQYAFNIWKPTLFFKDLKVNGPVVVGAPGCLKSSGPDFGKLMTSYPGLADVRIGLYSEQWIKGVCDGVSSCVKNYIDNVTVPGLPWYPAFAVFPGPVAPPMPNIPSMLVMCPSVGLPKVTVPQQIQDAIVGKLSSKIKQNCPEEIHKTIALAIGTSLATGFGIWIATQTVNLVMGTGQIPTFAPPFVPAGPVVMGQNIPSGGGNLMP